MVGVAGKSQGCGTCRKRKVKCDESRPVCSRCRKARLPCDGYARYPVFIDRSQTGYRKRRPLEEVKFPLPLSPVHSPEAESTRLISWFCTTFSHALPSQHNAQTRTHWLQLVAAQRSVHPALQTALLAISCAKWADVEPDPSIRHNGRMLYQKSLYLTRKAMSNLQDAVLDDILATASVMTLFELSDSTGQDLDNWLKHMSGIRDLMRLRGPSGFCGTASRAMFEHMRYIFMIRHLIARTSCVFGRSKWLEVPWQGVMKPLEQQVFDQGLRLANLFEQSDTIKVYDSLRQRNLLSTAIDIFGKTDSLAQSAPGTGDGSAPLLLHIITLGIQLAAASTVHKLQQILDGDKLDSCPISVDAPLETLIEADRIGNLRTEIARVILQSVEARKKTEMGALGALITVWSLALANQQFGPADPKDGHSRAMLIALSSKASLFDGLGDPSRDSDLPFITHAL